MCKQAAIIVFAIAAALASQTPTEAWPRAGSKFQSAPTAVDAAAKPPYPTAEMPGASAAGPGQRAANAPRTARHSRRAANAPQQGPEGLSGTGTVRSGKTGATAQVGAEYRAKFQAYVDELEARGARIKFMGGIRKGHCWSGSQHPCGMALDVCQTARGVVDRSCRLPPRAAVVKIARSLGLQEGGEWCHSDYGHVQAQVSAARCGANLYAAVAAGKRRIAQRHAGGGG